MFPLLPRSAARTREGQHVRACTEVAAPAGSGGPGSRRSEGRTGLDAALFPCDLSLSIADMDTPLSLSIADKYFMRM